jgi:hypothetical protein
MRKSESGKERRLTVDVSTVEQQLWPHGRNRDVWMILDGARDRKIHWELVNSYFEFTCLYSGDIAPELEAIAPYLVQLEFEDQSTRELIRRCWGKSWGVFLNCEMAMKSLRRHLRSFLLVNDWTGKRLLFRYYDPRVLRVYLPTCTSDELRSVYGPIKQFWTENETADRLVGFNLNRGGLVRSEAGVVSARDRQQTAG